MFILPLHSAFRDHVYCLTCRNQWLRRVRSCFTTTPSTRTSTVHWLHILTTEKCVSIAAFYSFYYYFSSLPLLPSILLDLFELDCSAPNWYVSSHDERCVYTQGHPDCQDGTPNLLVSRHDFDRSLPIWIQWSMWSGMISLCWFAWEYVASTDVISSFSLLLLLCSVMHSRASSYTLPCSEIRDWFFSFSLLFVTA